MSFDDLMKLVAEDAMRIGDDVLYTKTSEGGAHVSLASDDGMFRYHIPSIADMMAEVNVTIIEGDTPVDVFWCILNTNYRT